MPEAAEIHHPQQPDGIDEDSHDIPDVARAARRVRAYIAETGDGLYDVTNRRPLYARDLEALRRAGENLAELRAAYDQARDGLSRQRDTLTRERDEARAELAELVALGPEVTARRAVAADLDQLAASAPLTAAWLERHGLGPTAHVGAVLRAAAVDVTACRLHGRRERWDASVPPGGWICAEPDPDGPDGICGMPVEDVPCTVHHPDGTQ